MNPILLKPKRDMVSQVVVHGKPYKDLDARTYREEYLSVAEGIVKESLNRLRYEYDMIVIEGAGSPAEVNLKDRDIVNMRLAGWADAPVILIADIDRGGVFASIVGTMEILTPEERDRVQGFIINKFRGDVTLLEPGLRWLEERTGKPVLGVIPYIMNLNLEDEDSASLDAKQYLQKSRSGDQNIIGSALEQTKEATLDVAVIRLPRLSNFTDFDPLIGEQDVELRYISSVSDFGNPDAVIIPGSKNTVEDLLYLRESGLEALLLKHAHNGGRLVGICAGYQMMGEQLYDPHQVESDHLQLTGMALFPFETTFTKEKRTERVMGTARLHNESEELNIEGYEIHMGLSDFKKNLLRPFKIRIHHQSDHPESYHQDGVMTKDSKVWGTYLHGILHNDCFRREWLNEIRKDKGWSIHQELFLYKDSREAAFENLAEHVRKHLDMKQINQIINKE
jgi:cobyric acid synthase CobQ